MFFFRNGEPWRAVDHLKYSNLVSALVHRVSELEHKHEAKTTEDLARMAAAENAIDLSKPSDMTTDAEKFHTQWLREYAKIYNEWYDRLGIEINGDESECGDLNETIAHWEASDE